MIDVYINDSKVGIDKAAAISLNLINFDIKDISNRVLNYTNDFKIPVAGNELTFEFSSGINVTGDFPYTDFAVKIIADGIAVVDSGRGWITDVADGYYLVTVTDKPGVIQDMKDYSLVFPTSILQADTPKMEFNTLDELWNSTSQFKLDILYNDYQIDYAALNADKYRHNWRYQHISVYIKYIFDLFATSSGYTFSGSLWTDVEFLKLRTIAYAHVGKRSNSTAGIFYIHLNSITPDASFMDLFRQILKIFCATFKVVGSVIYIERFDSLDWDSPVDWSNKLVNVKSKKFQIPNTAQVNYLRYNVEGDVAKSFNQVSIPCNNENISAEAELINIEASLFTFALLTDLHTLISTNAKSIYLSDKETTIPVDDGLYDYAYSTIKSTAKFIFLTDGDQTVSTGFELVWDYFYIPSTVVVYGQLTHVIQSGDNHEIAIYYNSVNDYVRIAAMLQDPVFYEVELNLSPVDIHAFDPFNIVSIPELGGTFYVNSIKNYLLSSDKNTATVELIKIS